MSELINPPRAVLSRLNPKGPFEPMEYLHRIEELLAEDRWEWRAELDGAHRFPSHAIAWENAASHAYVDSRGKNHLPFPLVVAAPEVTAEPVEIPAPRSPKTIEERARIGRLCSKAKYVARRARVTPQESFERLERQHLA